MRWSILSVLMRAQLNRLLSVSLKESISKLYIGKVVHHRHSPIEHRFSYSLFMLYLDLDELPRLFDRYWFWSVKRFNFAQFRRQDHLVGKECLKSTVLDLVEAKTGNRPAGRVCLLTHLRYFGYVMNPVSFYYCFDATNQHILAIVAEVHNTPWGEQHAYVLEVDKAKAQKPNAIYQFEHIKDFHVSPFLPMDMRYRWRVSKPDETLSVFIENWQSSESADQSQRIFNVGMQLKQQPINSVTLAKCLVVFPLMTLKVGCAIYYQALRLWIKKIPFHPKPKTP